MVCFKVPVVRLNQKIFRKNPFTQQALRDFEDNHNLRLQTTRLASPLSRGPLGCIDRKLLIEVLNANIEPRKS